MKLLLPSRIGRDGIDLVNLWSIVMGIESVVFVRSVSSLGTKRSDGCCAVVHAAGAQRSGGRAHGVLQVAGEAVRLSPLFRIVLPPPSFIS